MFGASRWLSILYLVPVSYSSPINTSLVWNVIYILQWHYDDNQWDENQSNGLRLNQQKYHGQM